MTLNQLNRLQDIKMFESEDSLHSELSQLSRELDQATHPTPKLALPLEIVFEDDLNTQNQHSNSREVKSTFTKNFGAKLTWIRNETYPTYNPEEALDLSRSMQEKQEVSDQEDLLDDPELNAIFQKGYKEGNVRLKTSETKAHDTNLLQFRFTIKEKDDRKPEVLVNQEIMYLETTSFRTVLD